MVVASSRDSLSCAESRPHSCRARPRRWPASCISVSFSLYPFQSAARWRAGTQSSKRTSGDSPSNESIGGAFPLRFRGRLGCRSVLSGKVVERRLLLSNRLAAGDIDSCNMWTDSPDLCIGWVTASLPVTGMTGPVASRDADTPPDRAAAMPLRATDGMQHPRLTLCTRQC